MWAQREFSEEEYDEAGRHIDAGGGVDLYYNLGILNNWRAAHGFPLNTFQTTLRYRARQVEPNALVAQRIKRLVSIRPKLKRFRLTEIQDIAGCRAILQNVRNVDELVARYKDGSFKHDLDHEDDYIRHPKKSGYRGVHLIFRYYSDKKDDYNGLKVELQIRSARMHAWATAVETVGLFTGNALKSSRGDDDWLEFFKLTSSFIAMKERQPLVPKMPTKRQELREAITNLDSKLRARAMLTLLAPVVNYTSQQATANGYFLLQLEPQTQAVTVTPFKKAAVEAASAAYLRAESAALGSDKDVVLVSVDSISKLTRAYPNYFLDTRKFLTEVNSAIIPA